MMYWDGPKLIRDIDEAMGVVSPVIQFLKEERRPFCAGK